MVTLCEEMMVTVQKNANFNPGYSKWYTLSLSDWRFQRNTYSPLRCGRIAREKERPRVLHCHSRDLQNTRGRGSFFSSSIDRSVFKAKSVMAC